VVEVAVNMEITADTPTQTPPNGQDRRQSIGAILVDQGRLKPDDAEVIQRFATEHSVRFGAAAVRLGLLSEKDVENALGRQYRHAVLLCGEGGVAQDVITAHDPQNALVEPIRALRTQLMFSWLNDCRQKVLAITSPDRHEGRSWIAANLAVAFAQMGERTLLIDADMRNAQQHRYFNLDNSLGLSALLTGRAGISTVVRVNPELRLFVLPAGNAPPNPQELLSRSIFAEVIRRCASQYDLVLIDTPAAAETSDAQVIAGKAGAAVMIARRNLSRSGRLISATQRLRTAGVNIVGCILNEH
jgi:chain length determinant protein tyrosine kinase EpsG